MQNRLASKVTTSIGKQKNNALIVLIVNQMNCKGALQKKVSWGCLPEGQI